MNKTNFENWIKKEKLREKDNKRRYLHFDRRIRLNDKRVQSLKSFFLKADVECHSFYPLIRTVISSPRYKKVVNSETKKSYRQKEKKDRSIAYASHFDSLIYSYYSFQLTALYWDVIKSLRVDDCVLAYLEKGKSNIHFANEAFDFIRSKGECVVIALDVTSFFDNMDHEILKEMWCNVIGEKMLPKDHYKVFKSLTNYAYVDLKELEKVFPELKLSARKREKPIHRVCEPKEFREKVRSGKLIQSNPNLNKNPESSRYGRQCGIPQGSPISATLSNIYMTQLDVEINYFLSKVGGLYRRYSDDLLLICPIEFYSQAISMAQRTISKYELKLNPDKTDITIFKYIEGAKELSSFSEKGFQKKMQYLGFEFDGDNIYIRSSSLSKYYGRLNRYISRYLRKAYGRRSKGEFVNKKKLYNNYTDKGNGNFITYGKKAGRIMDSMSTKKQVSRSQSKVKLLFDEKQGEFLRKKGLKNE